MTYREDQHNQAKSDMLGEFNKAILDAEDLRKAESDDGSAAAQENLEEEPGSAGADAAGASRTVVETGERKLTVPGTRETHAPANRPRAPGRREET